MPILKIPLLSATVRTISLDGGLSPGIENSDVMERSGHPCRVDFERFGVNITCKMELFEFQHIGTGGYKKRPDPMTESLNRLRTIID